jgi:hypothetical protein
MTEEESKNILRAVLAISMSTPPKLGEQIELPATPCAVWLVTWEQQDGPISGVHGVFEGEQNAREVALGMSINTRGFIYKASSWVVIPDAGAEARDL